MFCTRRCCCLPHLWNLLIFAVFSVSDDSDSGEFVVLVNQLGLSTSCSNFLKKLLQNSKSSQKLPQNPKVAQKLLSSNNV